MSHWGLWKWDLFSKCTDNEDLVSSNKALPIGIIWIKQTTCLFICQRVKLFATGNENCITFLFWLTKF